jgi:hypothetical protein
MGKKKEKKSEPELSAEEIIKQELAHEKVERMKAGRLLGLGPGGIAGSGVVLVVGLALLLCLLGASPVLAAVLGGVGATAIIIFTIMNPFRGNKKHGGD